MAKKIKIEDYEKEEVKEQKSNNKNEKRDRLKFCSLILNGVFGVCLVVLLVMYMSLNSGSVSQDQYDSMLDVKNSRISSLEGEYYDLLDGNTYSYVKDKLEFFDDKIVFKIKGFGNYYYSYDCMMNKTNGSFEALVYSKEAAINDGLKAGGC